MLKKGQVTIFIIIAVILVASVGLFFTFRDKLKGSGVPSDVENIHLFVENCIDTTSKEGLYQIGQHGGYYNVPKQTSIVYFTEEVPYYYLDNNIHIPSIEIIERELSDYIYDNLNECMFFEDFKRSGINISAGNYSISTEIKEETIKIKIRYPLTIEKTGTVFRLEDFQLIIDSNIKKLQGVSKEIVNTYVKEPGFVCLTCLEDLSKTNNVIIKAVPVLDVSTFENDIIWFLITDKEYDLNDKNLTLRFIVEQ